MQVDLVLVAGLCQLLAEREIRCHATADTDCFQARFAGRGDGFFNEAVDDCLLKTCTDVSDFLFGNFKRFKVDFSWPSDGIANGRFQTAKAEV